MKISKNILESIIRQVIREQEELDPSESVDSVALKQALASADVLPVARYAWKAIMKFVGMTAGPSMENSHFQPVEDLSLWGVEDAYQFGLEVTAPF